MIDAGLTNGVPWSIQGGSDITITVRIIPECCYVGSSEGIIFFGTFLLWSFILRFLTYLVYCTTFIYYTDIFSLFFIFYMKYIIRYSFFLRNNFYLFMIFIFIFYRFSVLDTFLNWIFNSHCTFPCNLINICYRFLTTGIIIIPRTIVFSWWTLMFVIISCTHWMGCIELYKCMCRRYICLMTVIDVFFLIIANRYLLVSNYPFDVL